jgi:hypothetical protein
MRILDLVPNVEISNVPYPVRSLPPAGALAEDSKGLVANVAPAPATGFITDDDTTVDARILCQELHELGASLQLVILSGLRRLFTPANNGPTFYSSVLEDVLLLFSNTALVLHQRRKAYLTDYATHARSRFLQKFPLGALAGRSGLHPALLPGLCGWYRGLHIDGSYYAGYVPLFKQQMYLDAPILAD